MSINKERLELIKVLLEDETIQAEEEEILHMLLNERLSNDLVSNGENMTFGQKSADSLAKFAGSWGFIIVFFIILFGWILLNSKFLANPFDAYPFILMNLILSCTAAIQAPVIMMSQNRQEEKDRLRAQNDYKVNLKSEIIIEDIHQKLDNIIENQQFIFEKLDELDKRNK